MKNELKEIIQEKCRKFVKYNSFDFNEFENNVLEKDNQNDRSNWIWIEE